MINSSPPPFKPPPSPFSPTSFFTTCSFVHTAPATLASSTNTPETQAYAALGHLHSSLLYLGRFTLPGPLFH